MTKLDNDPTLRRTDWHALLRDDLGGTIIIGLSSTVFQVNGCPAADGGASCCRHCGAGWPGTQITSEAMTQGVISGQLEPSRLGCQPLEDRARLGMQQYEAPSVFF